MSQTMVRERLRRETGESFDRIATLAARRRDRDERPRPGDLFVLHPTRELPVEWLVVREREDGRLFAIAADTSSAVGSADVAVPASASCGPLSLRCGFGVWLDADAFDPELRTGSLEEIYLGHARRKLLELERGDATGTWAERRTDDELAHGDWCRDVLAEAVALLEGSVAHDPAASVEIAPRHRRPIPWLGLAAAAVVILALGIQTLRLERRVEQLSLPSINPPVLEIDVLDTTRSPRQVLDVPVSAAQVILYLNLPPELEDDAYRVEILEENGARVWRSAATQPRKGLELVLTVPASRLKTGFYRLRLEGEQGGAFRAVSEEPLQIRFIEP